MQAVLNSPVGPFAFPVFFRLHLFLTVYGIRYRCPCLIGFGYGRHAGTNSLQPFLAGRVLSKPFHIIFHIILTDFHSPMVKVHFFPVPAFLFQFLLLAPENLLFKIQGYILQQRFRVPFYLKDIVRFPVYDFFRNLFMASMVATHPFRQRISSNSRIAHSAAHHLLQSTGCQITVGEFLLVNTIQWGLPFANQYCVRIFKHRLERTV